MRDKVCPSPSESFSPTQQPTHPPSDEIYVINPCGPLASPLSPLHLSLSQLDGEILEEPLLSREIVRRGSCSKAIPPKKVRMSEAKPKENQKVRLPKQSSSPGSVSYTSSLSSTTSATSTTPEDTPAICLPYPEKIACEDITTVVSTVVSLACCPGNRRYVSAFLCVFEQFGIGKAQLFHSLISFKEKNGGKQGGAHKEKEKEGGEKEGLVFVVAEWMRLLGRNYFETDENFMRQILEILSGDPCFVKIVDQFQFLQDPTITSPSFTPPLHSNPNFPPAPDFSRSDPSRPRSPSASENLSRSRSPSYAEYRSTSAINCSNSSAPLASSSSITSPSFRPLSVVFFRPSPTCQKGPNNNNNTNHNDVSKCRSNNTPPSQSSVSSSPFFPSLSSSPEATKSICFCYLKTCPLCNPVSHVSSSCVESPPASPPTRSLSSFSPPPPSPCLSSFDPLPSPPTWRRLGEEEESEIQGKECFCCQQSCPICDPCSSDPSSFPTPYLSPFPTSLPLSPPVTHKKKTPSSFSARSASPGHSKTCFCYLQSCSLCNPRSNSSSTLGRKFLRQEQKREKVGKKCFCSQQSCSICDPSSTSSSSSLPFLPTTYQKESSLSPSTPSLLTPSLSCSSPKTLPQAMTCFCFQKSCPLCFPRTSPSSVKGDGGGVVDVEKTEGAAGDKASSTGLFPIISPPTPPLSSPSLCLPSAHISFPPSTLASLSLPKEEDLLSLFSISLFDLGGVREIAEKVTYYMWKSYKMISPSELFDGHWQGEKREREAPNIHKLGNIFNQFSSVCAISILSAPEDDRLDILVKVIELAYLLKKMKNYEGMGAVGGVFGQASIQRLKPLWASLPKKVIMKKREVERLLNPRNNYGALEKYISHARSEGLPCIPLIAPRLRTLRYLYDSQSKIEEGMIAFSFLMKTGGHIYKILRGKGKGYNIQVTEHLADALRCVLETDLHIDFNDLEDALYGKSMEILER